MSPQGDPVDSIDLDGDKDVWGWTKNLIVQQNDIYKPWFQLATRHKLVCLDKNQICRDLGAIQKNQVADSDLPYICSAACVPCLHMPYRSFEKYTSLVTLSFFVFVWL